MSVRPGRIECAGSCALALQTAVSERGWTGLPREKALVALLNPIELSWPVLERPHSPAAGFWIFAHQSNLHQSTSSPSTGHKVVVDLPPGDDCEISGKRALR